MLEQKHSRIGFICFLNCVFANVSSNVLPEKRHSHIGCICSAFLHCVFSNVSSNCLPEKRQSYIGCICLVFLHCVFSNVSYKCKHCDYWSNDGLTMTFCMLTWSNTDWWPLRLNIYLHLKFDHFCYFMSPWGLANWKKMHCFVCFPLCIFKCILKWLASAEA